jgi:CheY-like chemotaxis protein
MSSRWRALRRSSVTFHEGCAYVHYWMRELSVLIVEDDEDFRALMREALEMEGFGVREAHDGQEALALLRASGASQCLVLLDLMMPGMTGWEFVATVRGDPLLRGNPIVVTTVVPEDAPWAVDATLQKPFDLEMLVQVVERYCSRTPVGSGREPDFSEAVQEEDGRPLARLGPVERDLTYIDLTVPLDDRQRHLRRSPRRRSAMRREASGACRGAESPAPPSSDCGGRPPPSPSQVSWARSASISSLRAMS